MPVSRGKLVYLFIRAHYVNRCTSQYYTECLHCGHKAKSGSLATDLDLIVPVKGHNDLADAFYEMQKSDNVDGVDCDSE